MNRRSFFRSILQTACVAVASKVMPSSLVASAAADASRLICTIDGRLVEFAGASYNKVVQRVSIRLDRNAPKVGQVDIWLLPSGDIQVTAGPR